MPTIYHYTTAAGLAGILSSRSLWATDTKFLNDKNEFVLGWDLFRSFYDKNKKKLTNIGSDVIYYLEGYMLGIDYTDAFVASFSANGDLLSQWRGYNGGYGFSISFDEEILLRAARSQNFMINRVVYDPDLQARRMEEAFENFMKDLVAGGESDIARICLKWWRVFIRIVVLIKDRHFSEEGETRLYAEEWSNSKIKVHYTDRRLIPYLEIKLGIDATNGEEFSSLGISHIKVGPAMADNQQHAAECLLKQYNIDAPVYRSSIPYIAS